MSEVINDIIFGREAKSVLIRQLLLHEQAKYKHIYLVAQVAHMVLVPWVQTRRGRACHAGRAVKGLWQSSINENKHSLWDK